MRIWVGAAFACAMFMGGSAQAAEIIFGGLPASFGDCTPRCTPTIQFGYGSSTFSGVSDISSVGFAFGGGAPQSGTYSFTLSTSRNAASALSTNFADNLGLDAQAFYTGAFSATADTDGFYNVTGPAFRYDPTAGDLLVQVTGGDGAFSSGASAYVSGADGGRAYQLFGSNVAESGYVPNTKFGVTSVGGVGAGPEPGTWAMMIFGFGVVGGVLRRRQRPMPGVLAAA